MCLAGFCTKYTSFLLPTFSQSNRKLSEAEKVPFNKRALELREKHKADHPDYKYTPRRRNNNKSEGISTASSTPPSRSDKPPRRPKSSAPKRPIASKTNAVAHSSPSPTAYHTNGAHQNSFEMSSIADNNFYEQTASAYGLQMNRLNCIKTDPYNVTSYNVNIFDQSTIQRHSPCSTASSNLSCTTLTPPATPHSTAVLGASSPNKSCMIREREPNTFNTMNSAIRAPSEAFYRKYNSDACTYQPLTSYTGYPTVGSHCNNEADLEQAYSNPTIPEAYNTFGNDFFNDDIPSGIQTFHDLSQTMTGPHTDKKFACEIMDEERMPMHFVHLNDSYSYQMN